MRRRKRATSQRTKAALAAWKARNPDRRLGCPQGFKAEAIQAGKAKRVEKAAARAARITPTVKFMRDNGKTLAGPVAHLTELGIQTPRGGPWRATQVSRVRGTGSTAEAPSMGSWSGFGRGRGKVRAKMADDFVRRHRTQIDGG